MSVRNAPFALSWRSARAATRSLDAKPIARPRIDLEEAVKRLGRPIAARESLRRSITARERLSPGCSVAATVQSLWAGGAPLRSEAHLPWRKELDLAHESVTAAEDRCRAA